LEEALVKLEKACTDAQMEANESKAQLEQLRVELEQTREEMKLKQSEYEQSILVDKVSADTTSPEAVAADIDEQGKDQTDTTAAAVDKNADEAAITVSKVEQESDDDDWGDGDWGDDDL
jgi:ABC-type uncharacterized transport system involved in gliding motility auxiliary subunit